MGRFEVTIRGKRETLLRRVEKGLHLNYLIYLIYLIYVNFVTVPCFLVTKEKVRLQVLFESAYSVFEFGVLVASGKKYLST